MLGTTAYLGPSERVWSTILDMHWTAQRFFILFCFVLFYFILYIVSIFITEMSTSVKIFLNSALVFVCSMLNFDIIFFLEIKIDLKK